ncbi:unnamed protein product [Paramecium pentaurelia]|uniref:Transmembrane protein n=1 Tax=Paramecium pentaurelia TaxID=43138 RepID=A0A8S1WKV2_9CILI|nr:unnamed protein product [Paramecium pentaurelia]
MSNLNFFQVRLTQFDSFRSLMKLSDVLPTSKKQFIKCGCQKEKNRDKRSQQLESQVKQTAKTIQFRDLQNLVFFKGYINYHRPQMGFQKGYHQDILDRRGSLIVPGNNLFFFFALSFLSIKPNQYILFYFFLEIWSIFSFTLKKYRGPSSYPSRFFEQIKKKQSSVVIQFQLIKRSYFIQQKQLFIEYTSLQAFNKYLK